MLGDDKVFGCVNDDDDDDDDDDDYDDDDDDDSKGLRIISSTVIVCTVPLPVSGTQSS